MRLRHWIPFIAFSALILVFSTDVLTKDGDYVTNVLQPLGNRAADLGGGLYNKSRHVVAFVLLGLLTYPLRMGRRARPLTALLCCAAVGLASEILQAFTRLRHPQVSDVFLDLGASVLGVTTLFSPPRFLQHGKHAFLFRAYTCEFATLNWPLLIV